MSTVLQKNAFLAAKKLDEDETKINADPNSMVFVYNPEDNDAAVIPQVGTQF